jgi:hypothetical protein
VWNHAPSIGCRWAPRTLAQGFANPCDLVKVRMIGSGLAAAGPAVPQYRWFLPALVDIVKSDGLSGLYKGLGANVGRAVCENVLLPFIHVLLPCFHRSPSCVRIHFRSPVHSPDAVHHLLPLCIHRMPCMHLMPCIHLLPCMHLIPRIHLMPCIHLQPPCMHLMPCIHLLPPCLHFLDCRFDPAKLLIVGSNAKF